MNTDRQRRDVGDRLYTTLCDVVKSKLKPYRKVDLPSLCDEIDLPHAPYDEELTKREYIWSRLAKLDRSNHAQIRGVAAKFATRYPLGDEQNDGTYKIEELLWEARGPLISLRVRRKLASCLDQVELFTEPKAFLGLLEKLFVLDPSDSLYWSERKSLHWKIQQHVIRNPEDWSVTKLFQELGALNCTSVRFRKLIEALASSEARPSETSQKTFVKVANSVLRVHGFELVETDEIDGYPSFAIITLGDTARGRPKNLIFGSPVKPDLRFRDAVNNDVEIVKGKEHVLVYDKPIRDALLWNDLQSWWAERNGIVEPERAKKSLYKRLLDGLPQSSPPQRLLFEAYYRHYGAKVPGLPALLPEVWLHYDPKTVRERGREALLRQRMDFLMLLSSGVRVVLEVDGKQHYSWNGRPASNRYAKLVMADRDLKLNGYDVYRFGASELVGDAGKRLVAAFFDELFRKHGIV